MEKTQFKQVAILVENGSCVSLSLCKVVNDKEYNQLLNQVSAFKHTKELEKQEEVDAHNCLCEKIKTLECEIEELKHEIKVLKGEDEDEKE